MLASIILSRDLTALRLGRAVAVGLGTPVVRVEVSAALAVESNVKFMVTGAVLLLAVIIDSLSRRSRAAHGRA